jgi:anti-sigma regulatory factor (Ser/Thr protein kinase)
LRLQVTWRMITFAAWTREMRLSAVGPAPIGAQVVAVARTEDASVSHDRLLTVSGYARPCAERLPLGLADVLEPADVARCREADQPVATYSLPPDVESARRARELIRLTLQEWGMTEQGYMAELVVSELVTNSLRHGLLSTQWMPGEHPIGLTILRRVPYLMCLVTDPGSEPPVRMDPCAGAEGGRGLQVVESCSVRWGWQPIEGAGKVVWALLGLAELRRPGQVRPGHVRLSRMAPSCPRCGLAR